MKLPKKKPIGIRNDPLTKTGRSERKGALIPQEKVSPLAPELHQNPGNNLKMVLFTRSPILGNSIKSVVQDVIEIDEFSYPEQMISWCEKTRPLYVIIDVDSPTPWTEALDIFNSLRITLPATKQIVLTSLPRGNIPKRMHQHGAHALLKKPFSAEGLLEVI